MFENNPCRQNLFEVFQIDPSTTNLRAIMAQVKDIRDVWRYQRFVIKARDGSEFTVDEARMNELEARLFDPLKRLKEEQFTHEAHPFARDAELAGAVQEFNITAGPGDVSTGAKTAVLNVLVPLVPPVPAPRYEDDLPWPEPPQPFPVQRESLEQAIFRDF